MYIKIYGDIYNRILNTSYQLEELVGGVKDNNIDINITISRPQLNSIEDIDRLIPSYQIAFIPPQLGSDPPISGLTYPGC